MRSGGCRQGEAHVTSRRKGSRTQRGGPRLRVGHRTKGTRAVQSRQAPTSRSGCRPDLPWYHRTRRAQILQRQGIPGALTRSTVHLGRRL
jgi:hypothetical protein